MSLVILLTLLVAVVGLVVYFVCAGFTKASVADVAKSAFVVGLLAFLLGASGSVEGCSVSSTPHHIK